MDLLRGSEFQLCDKQKAIYALLTFLKATKEQQQEEIPLYVRTLLQRDKNLRSFQHILGALKVSELYDSSPGLDHLCKEVIAECPWKAGLGFPLTL